MKCNALILSIKGMSKYCRLSNPNPCEGSCPWIIIQSQFKITKATEPQKWTGGILYFKLVLCIKSQMSKTVSKVLPMISNFVGYFCSVPRFLCNFCFLENVDWSLFGKRWQWLLQWFRNNFPAQFDAISRSRKWKNI